MPYLEGKINFSASPLLELIHTDHSPPVNHPRVRWIV
jgi:hypothetical protein